MEENKEYLGDAVYVQLDSEQGQGIILTMEDGVVHDKIYLEPEVIMALMEYLQRHEL